MIKPSKEEIGKCIVDQLYDVLSSVNSEQTGEVLEVDETNQTITIKLKYYVVPEDNYIGLGSY